MVESGAAYRLFVGIDVAADTFTAAWLPPGGAPTPPISGEQSPPGYAALQRRLACAGRLARPAPSSRTLDRHATRVPRMG